VKCVRRGNLRAWFQALAVCSNQEHLDAGRAQASRIRSRRTWVTCRTCKVINKRPRGSRTTSASTGWCR
jgi:hypothetical protein